MSKVTSSINIPQPSIAGRIGTGIGKGLAEQLPEEITRGRLQHGLQQLGNQPDLDPFQAWTQLASTPGATPQMIQSGTELLKQRQQAQALQNARNQPPPSFQRRNGPGPEGQPPSSKYPSLTTPSEKPKTLLEEIQHGYIPPTQDDITENAIKAWEEKGPAFFKNDTSEAVKYAEAQAARQEEQFNAKERQYNRLSDIQKGVVDGLRQQSGTLGVGIDSNLYSMIEDQAIQATKPKSEGGRGLDQQQAKKEFGQQLNDYSRLFRKLGDDIGDWSIAARPAKSTLSSLREMENKAYELDQKNNTDLWSDTMAKKMVEQNKVTEGLAYATFQPVRRVPELNSVMKSLPDITLAEQQYESIHNPESEKQTLRIAPQLAKIVRDNPRASPAAIGYELRKKGYDPDVWRDYLSNHPEYNLRSRQSEQLITPPPPVRPWNDWWLSSFSGIE